MRRYVDELADVGAAALVIELVRRYHRPPDALVHACRARGLPLVTLAKDVNFLEVTQVVHALILGNQAEAMRRTQHIHEAFTALTLRGAGPEDVVRAAAEMSGHTVVLENLVHQALICEPSGSTVRGGARRLGTALPGDPAPPTARPSPARRGGSWHPWSTRANGGAGWPCSPPRTARPLPRAFGPEDFTVLERTAMALTIARLIHPTPWERTAHRNALRDLVEQRHRSPADARARCAALGLPTRTAASSPCSSDCRTRTTRREPESPSRPRSSGRQGTQALVGDLGPRPPRHPAGPAPLPALAARGRAA